METKPTYFQKDLWSLLDSRQTFFSQEIYHQVPAYLAWKLDKFSKGTDAFQLSSRNLNGYAFPSFCFIGRVLRKDQVENATIILITQAWQAQPWYPKELQMSIHNPVLIPKGSNLLIGLDFQRHYLKKTFSLISNTRRSGTLIIINRPRESGIAGWSKRIFDPIERDLNLIRD